MEREAFLDRYPEFGTAEEDQLESVLAEAERSLDSAIFGERFDDAHGALTAHLLWTTPFGVSLGRDADPEPPKKSRYWQEYQRIVMQVTPRALVT